MHIKALYLPFAHDNSTSSLANLFVLDLLTNTPKEFNNFVDVEHLVV